MIASGFFAAKKISREMNWTKITKLCIKNWLLIYCIWSILWLPYYIKLYYFKYSDMPFMYRFFLIIRRIVLAGQGVYWYLLVLAEAVFIVYIFVHFGKEKLLCCFGITGLLLGIFYDANVTFFGMDVIHKIVYSIFSWSNNVFMKGIPYVAFGYFLRRKREQLHFKIGKLMVLYLAASIGTIFLYTWDKEQWLCLYPVQASCLFLMVCQSTWSKISKNLCLSCRNMSSAIYFLHTVSIYGIIDPIFGVDSPIILKFSVSIVFSIAVLYIVKRMKIYPIEWLLGVK